MCENFENLKTDLSKFKDNQLNDAINVLHKPFGHSHTYPMQATPELPLSLLNCIRFC